jgi:predicted PhzF superfamily epimerase YddE/YHI9
VDLCGHATLASAHVLWEEGHLPAAQPARFHTRSGVLAATRDGKMIWLDFPATPSHPADAPPNLRGGIGAAMLYVGRTSFDYLVELDSESRVRSLAPDLAALARRGTRGVIVTARSTDPAYDFVSRFFAPGSGIAEDPVTGSAHCGLGPSGRTAWVRRSWSGIRHRRGAAPSGCVSRATGLTSAVRR